MLRLAASLAAGFEGRSRFARGESAPGAVPPLIERRHAQGSCSIIDGVISRDPAVPALRGRYLFSDFCDNRILTSLSGGVFRLTAR